MNVTSGVDWFDLAGTIDFDGMTAELPEILEALRRGQNYVRLSDGSRGLLPQEWLAKFASMIELGKAEDGAIRFRSSQALLLDALLAAQEQVTVDAPLRGSARTSAVSTALARPTNRGDSAGNCGTIKRPASAGSASWRNSASAAAWPTTWAWARRCRCWRCCKSGAIGIGQG